MDMDSVCRLFVCSAVCEAEAKDVSSSLLLLRASKCSLSSKFSFPAF